LYFINVSNIYTSLPPSPIWVWFEALISSYFYLRHAHIITYCPLFPPQGGNRFDSYIMLTVHIIACFYRVFIKIYRDEFIIKHILLKTYFCLFLFCSVLNVFVYIRAWGGGEGGGGERVQFGA
jgi:hypothetical protein